MHSDGDAPSPVKVPEATEVLATREREERSVTTRAFLRLYSRRSPREASRGSQSRSTGYSYRRAWVDFGLFLRWRLGEGPLSDWTDTSGTHRAAMTDEALAYLDRQVSRVRPTDIEHYISKSLNRPLVDRDGRPKMGIQPTTLGSRLGALSMLFDTAVTMGLIEGSPMADVRRPRTPGSKPYRKRGLSEADVRRLIVSIDKGTFIGCRDRMLITVLARLGLRRAEAAGLLLSDLELTEPEDLAPGLVVDVARMHLRRKGDKQQAILLPEDLVPPLRDYIAMLPGPALFPAVTPHGKVTGMPIDPEYVTRLVRRRSRAALGRPVSPHALRRTFITVALDAGAPVHVVQRYVGHEDPKTTVGYFDDSQARETCAAEYVSYGEGPEEEDEL